MLTSPDLCDFDDVCFDKSKFNFVSLELCNINSRLFVISATTFYSNNMRTMLQGDISCIVAM